MPLIPGTQGVTHPARYSDQFLPVFASLLRGLPDVLDPMAGTGKLGGIKRHGFTGRVICNEIEPEYAALGDYPVDEWHFGDAASMGWAPDGSYAAVCTSPTYGNRIADNYVPPETDTSTRFTYRLCLGHALHEGNTGAMQWGEKYREKHTVIYHEIRRVLRPAGVLIINVSNHIRKGAIVDVVGWNRATLSGMGFIPLQEVQIPTHRLLRGSNSALRVPAEAILVFGPGLPPLG